MAPDSIFICQWLPSATLRLTSPTQREMICVIPWWIPKTRSAGHRRQCFSMPDDYTRTDCVPERRTTYCQIFPSHATSCSFFRWRRYTRDTRCGSLDHLQSWVPRVLNRFLKYLISPYFEAYRWGNEVSRRSVPLTISTGRRTASLRQLVPMPHPRVNEGPAALMSSG